MRCMKYTSRSVKESSSDTASSSLVNNNTSSSSIISSASVQSTNSVRRSPRDSVHRLQHTVQQVHQTLTQSSNSQVKTTRAMPAVKPASNAIAPKSIQSDSKPGGGRHPHPPVGNNAKLKHQCPFDGCPWRFATPYKLRRHIKSHTKETPYLCKECGRGFSVRYNLLMHIQTIHSQPQKFKCPMRGCKDAFHSQSRLNGHLRRVHKKDWKTLHAKDVKSETESTTDVKTTAKYECPDCKRECSSQAKLTAHRRSHNTEKTFKCTVEGCDKVFYTKDKLNKHGDTHKNNKRQFSCPHKNCNRVFIRQCHLKNHLKIHTQDHQFICPVLDCNMKFTSESEYNVHLNSHINYGYKCPHQGCELSFPCKKRLAFHTRVVHNATPTTDSAAPQLLDGIQPHVPIVTSVLPLSIASPTSKSLVDKELIKDVDLPGLSVEDIEVILSENEDWSGEQIDQFLRSAVDLSEIESKFFSNNNTTGGYESDSGYSTYDVSPVTSTVQSSGHQISCVPPQIMSVEPNPLFSLSNTATSFTSTLNHLPQSQLLTESSVSPCGSDVGFFSPNSEYSSLASTPSHDSGFFSTHPPCPIFTSYVQSQNFTVYSPTEFPLNMNFGDTSVTNTNSTIPCFSSQIPDILLTSVTPPKHSGRRASDSQLTVLCGNESIKSSRQSSTGSLPNLGNLVREPEIAGDLPALKIKSEPNSCMASCSVENHLQILASLCSKTPGLWKLLTTSNHATILNTLPTLHMDTNDVALLQNTLAKVTCEQLSELKISPVSFSMKQNDKIQSTNQECAPVQDCRQQELTKSSKVNSKVPKVSHTPMKVSGRKKSQWPRSMNKANLMAFRQHILNKLKKGHVVNVAESATQHSDPILSKCGESFSCPSNFEVQVTCEQNDHSSNIRCHSEPADMLNSQSPVGTLHSSISVDNVSSRLKNEGVTFGDGGIQGTDCSSLLSAFQFNPDTLLSTSSIEDCLFDSMELKFEENVSLDREITQLLSDVTVTSSSSSSTPIHHTTLDQTSSVQTSPNVSPTNFTIQSSHSSSPQHSQVNPHDPCFLTVAGHSSLHPSYNISGQVIGTAVRPVNEVSFTNSYPVISEQNLLQLDRDPLLGGGNPILQPGGIIEQFDI